KSTVARLVAHDLQYVYVDTGAMYRAFTFLTLEAGHDPSSRTRMKQLLEKVDFHAEIAGQEISLREGKRDLAPHTRLPEVNAAVSPVSALPELREYLVNLQRKLRLSAPLVMEGRDIGTVVCSDSPFKYFMPPAISSTPLALLRLSFVPPMPNFSIAVKMMPDL
ncbi:MAG: hypothetical protein EBS60_08965, partial [Verrucomicrobia bacterium]|nr:hypothetical protein [Verrucomicrobiota bacterium]